MLNTENAEGFTVADDAVILLQDTGGLKKVSREEWMELLKFSGSNADKSYSVDFRQENHEIFISGVTEVYRP